MNQWRVRIVFVFFFLLGAAIVGRLAYLQIVQHGFYKALASGQQIGSRLAQGERGSIIVQDSSGSFTTLATNLSVPFLFASPAEIEDLPLFAERVEEAFGIDAEETLSKIEEDPQNQFLMLKRELSSDEAGKAVSLQLPGLYVGERLERSYPQGMFASHIAGFVNRNGEGQYGIEEYYQEELRGREGLKSEAKNPAQYLVSVQTDTVENGFDVELNIDYGLQAMAEAELSRAQEQLGAEEGLIIIADPRTGAILTLAAFPRFDPNEYAKDAGLERFQNPAHQKLFEPGSTFKPLTMAAAIEEGAITPDTAYVDTGEVKIGKYTIQNYNRRSFGRQTMTQVLEFSINTGAVFAERLLGDQAFLSFVERFGFFSPTDIDLAGEEHSSNRELKKGYEVNYATASFGQGIEVTPVQMVRAYGALANGGRLPSLRVASAVRREEVFEQIEHPLGPRVLSQKTSGAVTEMLVRVIENGYSKSARIPGYHIAGKTGTSQVSWSSMGVSKPGYSEKTIQSFIGYFPAYHPEFLVFVQLNDPETRTAEYSALPVFKRVAQFLINTYQIPPDYDIGKE